MTTEHFEARMIDGFWTPQRSKENRYTQLDLFDANRYYVNEVKDYQISITLTPERHSGGD